MSNNKITQDRISTIKELIFGDVSFSSDNVFGVSGQKKPISKELSLRLNHERSAVIKNLIDNFALDGEDIKAVIDGGGLKPWQTELLSNSVKDIVLSDIDNSLSQEQKFSLLLSRPESKEIMARDAYDVHLSKENQIILEKMPQMMNNNIAIAVLNGIHNDPDNFFGKGIYGKDADEVSENICKFIFNKGSMIGKDFAEMHSFQGWVEALNRAGFDEKESKFKSGNSKATVDFIESGLDLSTSKPSITYDTHRVTDHHDDISKKIHDMEDNLGLRADIVLTRFGRMKKKNKTHPSLFVEEKLKSRISPDSFDPTEFKKRRDDIEAEVHDSDVKKIVFRNNNGRPIMETIGDSGILRSRGVQIVDELKNVPIDKQTARLMVLQFTKMNPDKKKIVINPPKHCTPDVAKKFIKEIVLNAIEMGYDESAIKVTSGKGCPLSLEQVNLCRERWIEEAKKQVQDASLTTDAPEDSNIKRDPIKNDYSNEDEAVLKTKPSMKA